MTLDPTVRTREAIAATLDEVAADRARGGPRRDDTDRPAPPGDWSLTDATLRFLTALIGQLRPSLVLEFGSGRSTIELGRACASLGRPATLVSIENDPAHAERTRVEVVSHGLDATVHVHDAPVVVRRCHDRNVPVYLLTRGTGPRRDRPRCRPDLVVVDGPPLPLGGREGSLYQALHSAHEGTVIVLDDSRRESERDVLVRLLRQFDGRIEATDLLGYPKGLATIVVTERIPSDNFPEELTHV